MVSAFFRFLLRGGEPPRGFGRPPIGFVLGFGLAIFRSRTWSCFFPFLSGEGIANHLRGEKKKVSLSWQWKAISDELQPLGLSLPTFGTVFD